MKKHINLEADNDPIADEQPPYKDRDVRIITNNIFNELCLRDANDRAVGRPPASHDLRELSERVKACNNGAVVRQLAEDFLVHKVNETPTTSK